MLQRVNANRADKTEHTLPETVLLAIIAELTHPSLSKEKSALAYLLTPLCCPTCVRGLLQQLATQQLTGLYFR